MAIKPTLTEQDFESAAQRLGVEIAAIKAVAEVESRGEGFLDDGSPKILFERHIFHRLTKGKYSTAENRNISYRYASKKGTGKINEYGSTGEQHGRLQRAVALNRDAALQSASWGKFQIMGFNWESVGYDTLQNFINAMYRSEGDHLNAFVGFIEANGLAGAIRAKQWATFARGYNGPDYRINKYDTKLAAAYKKHGGR